MVVLLRSPADRRTALRCALPATGDSREARSRPAGGLDQLAEHVVHLGHLQIRGRRVVLDVVEGRGDGRAIRCPRRAHLRRAGDAHDHQTILGIREQVVDRGPHGSDGLLPAGECDRAVVDRDEDAARGGAAGRTRRRLNLGEVRDRALVPILEHHEIVFRQARDMFARGVRHDDVEVRQLHLDRLPERRRRFLRENGERKDERQNDDDCLGHAPPGLFVPADPTPFQAGNGSARV
jgi:hypothetical protein